MAQLFTLMFLLLRLAGKFVKDLFYLSLLRDFQTGAAFTTKISKVRFIVNLDNKEKRAGREKLGQNSWKYCLTKLSTPHSTNE